MQLYNSFIQLLLLSLFVLLIGCSNDGNNGSKNLDPNDFDWSKTTSFKYDFNSKNDYVKDLKRSDFELLDLILNGVEKGEVEAFHFYDRKQMSKNEIDNLFHPKDTVSVYDMALGKEVVKPTVGELNKATITKVRVEQEWYFDKEKFSMQSKVKAIAPMQTIFNSDGSERGDAPLFWVYLK